ncbi:hypothetical protein DY000_02001031 [Brassica cretica]|uniref:Protein kinase domain-containing protein n=1 Tax=Brassica cretica TaxID=69181 RepID=A0ABQ7BSJ4_BRACR|nr:hypothetical protein DY000_02001031 [Brassica cretica]
MGSLKHRNLVPLLGYCRRKGELLLVSEYMSNGSLDRYLHTGANQVVLHRDIKASNVMLDSEFNRRLGDFGMARFEDYGDSLPATTAIGTMGYMAPELTTMGTSTRTDVYAFGAFMLEVTYIRLGLECSEEEVDMVLKLGLLCTNVAAELRPNMEQVVQYINQNLPLPIFSPDSPGIGVYIPVLMEAAFTSRSSLAPSASPSPHNSMFVTHTITYGDGR